MKSSNSVITSSSDVSRILHETSNEQNQDDNVSATTTAVSSSNNNTSLSIVKNPHDWQNIPVVIAKGFMKMDKRMDMLALTMQKVASALSHIHLDNQQQRERERERDQNHQKPSSIASSSMKTTSSKATIGARKQQQQNEPLHGEELMKQLVEVMYHRRDKSPSAAATAANTINSNTSQQQMLHNVKSKAASRIAEPPKEQQRGDNSLVMVSQRRGKYISQKIQQQRILDLEEHNDDDEDDYETNPNDSSVIVSDLSNTENYHSSSSPHSVNNNNSPYFSQGATITPSRRRAAKDAKQFIYVTTLDAENEQPIHGLSLFGVQGPRGSLGSADQIDGETFYRVHSSMFSALEAEVMRHLLEPIPNSKRTSPAKQQPKQRENDDDQQQQQEDVDETSWRRKRSTQREENSRQQLFQQEDENENEEEEESDMEMLEDIVNSIHIVGEEQQHQKQQPQNFDVNVDESPRTKAKRKGSEWLSRIKQELSSPVPTTKSNENEEEQEEPDTDANNQQIIFQNDAATQVSETNQSLFFVAKRENINHKAASAVPSQNNSLDEDEDIQRRIKFLNSFSFRNSNQKQQTEKQNECRWRDCQNRSKTEQDDVVCGKRRHMKNPPDNTKNLPPFYQTSLRNFDEPKKKAQQQQNDNQEEKEKKRRERILQEIEEQEQQHEKEAVELKKRQEEKQKKIDEEMKRLQEAREEKRKKEEEEEEAQKQQKENASEWRKASSPQKNATTSSTTTIKSKTVTIISTPNKNDSSIVIGDDGIVNTPRGSRKTNNELILLPTNAVKSPPLSSKTRQQQQQPLTSKSPLSPPPLPKYRSWVFRTTGELISLLPAKLSTKGNGKPKTPVPSISYSCWTPCSVKEQDYSITHSLANDRALQEDWQNRQKMGKNSVAMQITLRADHASCGCMHHHNYGLHQQAIRTCSSCNNINNINRSPYLMEPSIPNPRSEAPILENKNNATTDDDLLSSNSASAADTPFLLRWCGYSGDLSQRGTFVAVASTTAKSSSSQLKTRICFFRPHVEIKADRHAGVVSKFDLLSACWNVIVYVNGEERNSLTCSPIESRIERVVSENSNEPETQPKFYFATCVDLELYPGDLVSFGFSRTTTTTISSKSKHEQENRWKLHESRILDSLSLFLTEDEQQYADMWYLQFSSRF